MLSHTPTGVELAFVPSELVFKVGGGRWVVVARFLLHRNATSFGAPTVNLIGEVHLQCFTSTSMNYFFQFRLLL